MPSLVDALSPLYNISPTLKILIVMMNFGNSPLLDMGTNQQQPQMMDAELQKMYEAIQQKRASINMQTQVSSTPLFDEIDKI